MTEPTVHANHRYLDRYGHDVVLTTYALGGEDDYGDATVIPTASTIKAIRRDGGSVAFARNPSGAIPTGDATFFVKDSVSLPDAELSAGATTPASKITDGLEYQVTSAVDQRNGLLAVTTERMR